MFERKRSKVNESSRAGTLKERVLIVDGLCWSSGSRGGSFCQGTKETIEQCKRCLRYLPEKGKRK